MAEKHVIKLSSIISFFKGEEKLISRGENAVESGHVTKVGCDGKLRILRGLVHASMRDRQYKVEIYFNSEWNIESAKCSCPRGQFQCHHMAALAIFGRYNVSATDKECAWTAKKPLKEKVSKIRDIYTTKAHRSTERDANEAEINAFRRFLAIFEGAVGFTWLLSEEVSEDEIILLAIEDIIFCKDYISCSNKTQYLEGKLKVKKEIVLKVACSTIGQNKNEKWLIYKKNRLSASNFGIVLSACKRNKYSPSLFKRLAGSYYLEHIKAIQWGREHEVEGITALERALNVKVVSTGLWLHDCGYLAASPDGLIGDDAILEVKCPYKYRESSMMEALKDNSNYILIVDDDGNVSVNKNHEYYSQIQGQLAITKRSICHLVVWTPLEVIITEIEAEDFSENLNLLKQFYLNHYIPFLLGENNL